MENGLPGTIASIRPEKGFGFIQPEGGGEDLFFHHSSIDRPLESLMEGQQIEYELDTDAEKPRAAKVALRGEVLTKASRLADRPPNEITDGHRGTVTSVIPDQGIWIRAARAGGRRVFLP